MGIVDCVRSTRCRDRDSISIESFRLVVSCVDERRENGHPVTPKVLSDIEFCRDMRALRRPLRLRGRWRRPKDGLYRVRNSKRVLGGFLVCHGRVMRASPCVRRRIHILAMRNAQYWGDPFACE